jgi:L-amino acid N-acyltransferase YncA
MLQARRAGLPDVPAIIKILDGVVMERASLDTMRRSEEEIRGWFSARHPVAVVADGDAVVAFAVAEPHKIRGLVGRVSEVSVFVGKTHRRQGAGRLAMAEVMAAARVMGCWKFVAYALAENRPARGLLAALDFREAGVLEKHLQIDSVWRDVVLCERLLMTSRRSNPIIKE